MTYNVDPLRLAKAFLQEANPELRKKIEDVLGELSVNPHVDMQTKFFFPAEPVMLTICRCEEFWIVYYLEHSSSSLKIVNIGLAKQEPSIR